ncbi:MAG TPA: ATP-binding protein [Bryobacteraceae bacterium]|nr:ATP-binding protein [Bryobacteraceae bacterium]
MFLGSGGTGKSHLAQAIGQAAILQGYRVLHRETHVLLDESAEAVAEGTRKEYMESISTVPLLIVDDFGLRILPHTAAEDLLEIIMRRYEPFSTLLTPTRPVEDWGKLLGDVAAVRAMLDRLLHHGHVLKCGPRSWRTKSSAGASDATMLLSRVRQYGYRMRIPGKIAATVSLAICAIGLATFAGYLLSILWQGHWKYPELVLPTVVTATAAILAVGVIAVINRRHLGAGAIVRMTALLIAGCSLSAAGLFFLLLANCSLSCSNRIMADVKSPTGQWRAVWYLQNCVATVRYCPSVSHVSILAPGEEPGGQGNAFSVAVEDGINLDWKSNDLLRISYPGVIRSLDLKKAKSAASTSSIGQSDTSD